MDLNKQIEITENSTGLDMMNEVRRRFSIYLYREVQKVLSVPAVNDTQARVMSWHLNHRLGTMMMLTILDATEVDQAVACIKRFLQGEAPAVIVFDSVKSSEYSKYSASQLLTIWNALLQQFFSHCLTVGSQTADAFEKDRLYAYAENAVHCWHDMMLMMPEEIKKAQEIIKEYRNGNTSVDTKYSGADVPSVE